MPQAQASIVIAGDPDRVFAITNDIARWPELFKEYNGATVLSFERSGRFARIEFELTNEDGETWQSWRLLDFVKREAVAQRGSPRFPFRYMHLTWTYEPVAAGVRMTWIQDFEMDPAAPVTGEQALARMTSHMEKNQEHFKRILENMPQISAAGSPALQEHALTVISPNHSICTLINTLTVRPENQQTLFAYLKQMTDEVVVQCPGFISSNFHLSKDGTHIINYAQWQSMADLQAMLAENQHHVRRCQELAESIDAQFDLEVVYCAYPGQAAGQREVQGVAN
ncbi:MAG TPA: SRPBCC family protein [Ktedonobacteraceae bacterium]|jgi:aromatase